MVHLRSVIIAALACISVRATEITGTVTLTGIYNLEGPFDITGDDFHIQGYLYFAGQGAICPNCVPGSVIGPRGITTSGDLGYGLVVVNGVSIPPGELGIPGTEAAEFSFSGPTTTVLPGVLTYSLPFTFSGHLIAPQGFQVSCIVCEPDLTGSGTAVIQTQIGGVVPYVSEETYYFAAANVPEPGTLSTVAISLFIAAALRRKRNISIRIITSLGSSRRAPKTQPIA